MVTTMNGWITTDPDNHQYCKTVSEKEYLFVQYIEVGKDDDNLDYWVFKAYINMDDFDEESLLSDLKPFGYNSFENVVYNYGDNSNQIIAECVFESLTTHDYDYVAGFDEEEAAIKLVEEIMDAWDKFYQP